MVFTLAFDHEETIPVVFNTDDSMMIPITGPLEADVGDKFIFTYDGVEYPCKLRDGHVNGEYGVFIGNPSMVGTPWEPFDDLPALYFYNFSANYGYLVLFEVGTHKLKIHKVSWFEELFINEAKPALESKKGGAAEPVLQEKTVQVMLEDVTITPDEGYDGISSVFIDNYLWKEKIASNDLTKMFYGCTSLTTVPLFDTSNVTATRSMFEGCASLTTVPLLDVSNVRDMYGMFKGCTSLTTVPLFDTSKWTTMASMFYGCTSLTTVPLFDTSNVTTMTSMFEKCTNLTTVPLFDTSKVTSMSSMFFGCTNLTTVPSMDIRKASTTGGLTNIFNSCVHLTVCKLRNISYSLQVGSGTAYGHLLTLDSLIHLIYECRASTYARTLTIGSANLEKLTNVYVRTIEITDEMRAEDDLIDEKLPFEVCESTDENAMLIVDYAKNKKWTIK